LPEKLRENNNTPEYWDTLYAKEIATQFGRPDEQRWDYILGHIGRHDKVLDFGCGWAEALLYMIPKRPYAKFVGIDYSSVAIDKAKELLPNVEFYCKDSLDELVTMDIDVITIQHTLEHIEDRKSIMEQAWLMLKPKGKLIVVLPLYDDWHEHPEIWTLEDIREFVKEWESKFSSFVVYRPTTRWTKPDTLSEEAIIVMQKIGGKDAPNK